MSATGDTAIVLLASLHAVHRRARTRHRGQRSDARALDRNHDLVREVNHHGT